MKEKNNSLPYVFRLTLVATHNKALDVLRRTVGEEEAETKGKTLEQIEKLWKKPAS